MQQWKPQLTGQHQIPASLFTQPPIIVEQLNARSQLLHYPHRQLQLALDIRMVRMVCMSLFQLSSQQLRVEAFAQSAPACCLLPPSTSWPRAQVQVPQRHMCALIPVVICHLILDRSIKNLSVSFDPCRAYFLA